MTSLMILFGGIGVLGVAFGIYFYKKYKSCQDLWDEFHQDAMEVEDPLIKED